MSNLLILISYLLLLISCSLLRHSYFICGKGAASPAALRINTRSMWNVRKPWRDILVTTYNLFVIA